MTDSPREEWPSSPPEPTDRHPPAVTADLPARKCIYCDEVIVEEQSDADFPYLTHTDDCESAVDAVHVRTNNEFGIVVPEKTGYIWTHQTGGFACRTVSIQGTYIPIGRVIDLNVGVDTPAIPGPEYFSDFDDPEEARTIYTRGLRASPDQPHGAIDLGDKLVAETLDGVYADEEAVREQKRESRDERIRAVWREIDAELPFAYDRVAAPFGRPVTQEGLRWVQVTGHQHEDPLFRRDWVDALIERESPVALYYPNSD